MNFGEEILVICSRFSTIITKEDEKWRNMLWRKLRWRWTKLKFVCTEFQWNKYCLHYRRTSILLCSSVRFPFRFQKSDKSVNIQICNRKTSQDENSNAQLSDLSQTENQITFAKSGFPEIHSNYARMYRFTAKLQQIRALDFDLRSQETNLISPAALPEEQTIQINFRKKIKQ